MGELRRRSHGAPLRPISGRVLWRCSHLYLSWKFPLLQDGLPGIGAERSGFQRRVDWGKLSGRLRYPGEKCQPVPERRGRGARRARQGS
jgi:hypothetical protein